MVVSSSDSIQSVSVPAFVHVHEPDPHLAFSISVSLPSRSYLIQHRYSEFADLADTLAQACGSPPPLALPAKHRASRVVQNLNPFRAAAPLGPADAELRRAGLERWLRAILADRDPRWRSARAFKDFLVAPPDADADSDPARAARAWTASEWTEEYRAVEDAARRLRAALDDRDARLAANDSGAHQAAKLAQTQLVDVVRRVGALATGLEHLARREAMTDGELARRSDLVQRIQGELEHLGRKTGNAPRIGAGRTRPRGTDEEPETTPSVARQALLGTGSNKATTRVLGAAAAGGPAQETAETRPLDNQGVMQLQQQYMDDQDSKLESLTAALRRQRHLGEMINQELALQEDVIDQLERGTDKVSGKIKNASKQMKRL
ncbi:hypothetical protein JCM11491_003319 [Sporobolomyces phaffii]